MPERSGDLLRFADRQIWNKLSNVPILPHYSEINFTSEKVLERQLWKSFEVNTKIIPKRPISLGFIVNFG